MRGKALWLTLAVIFLTACTSMHWRWVQQGKTEAEAEMDHQECHKTSMDARQCMEQKGYKLLTQ